TAIFMKRLGVSDAAALISGFTFAFSGWVVSWQGWSLLDSAMWLPLIFLSVDWLRTKPSPEAVGVASLAFALPVLGGHPEVAFHTAILGLLYATYRAFPLTPGGRRYLVAFGISASLSLMLAAVQLLPTLEWIRLIPRSLTDRWPTPPGVRVLAFLSRDLFHNPNVDGILIPEGAAYGGAIVIAALPFVWLWRKKVDVI